VIKFRSTTLDYFLTAITHIMAAFTPWIPSPDCRSVAELLTMRLTITALLNRRTRFSACCVSRENHS
jgi:hypothetical protein